MKKALTQYSIILLLLLDLAGCSQPVKEVPITPEITNAQTALQNAKEAYQHQDYAQAANWFRVAAEQGDAKGQYSLGVAYNEGKGVTQDYAQAAEWFRKAAEQGLPQAQNNLGFLYRQGQGIEQDKAQAAEWFRKAAEQGYAQAQRNLGLAYRDGIGVPKNPSLAKAWLQKAATQNDAEAQAALSALTHSKNSKKRK